MYVHCTYSARWVGGLWLICGHALISMKIVSWSDTGGIASTLFTRVGLLVKSRSKVVAPSSVTLVGMLTTWSRPLDEAMSSILQFSGLYLSPVADVSCSQLIPGRLKSPPRYIWAFVALIRDKEVSSFSRYSGSVCSGLLKDPRNSWLLPGIFTFAQTSSVPSTISSVAFELMYCLEISRNTPPPLSMLCLPSQSFRYTLYKSVGTNSLSKCSGLSHDSVPIRISGSTLTSKFCISTRFLQTDWQFSTTFLRGWSFLFRLLCLVVADVLWDLDSLLDWESKWQMSFHPDKCKVMSITRARKRKQSFSYHIRETMLETVKSAAYLGLELDERLDWSPHINKVMAKATRSLNFIRRNLRIGSQNVKSSAYRGLVRPPLDYWSIVWNPHLARHIQQVEMIQRRATRFVLDRDHNTSSVGEMLQILGWETLQERRAKCSVVFMYKILNQMIAVPATPHFVPAYDATRGLLVHKLLTVQGRTDYHSASYFIRVIPLWNRLPDDIAGAPSIQGETSCSTPHTLERRVLFLTSRSQLTYPH